MTKKKVTKAEASKAGVVLEQRKEEIAEAKEAKVKPFLSCGDCDAKLPVDLTHCPYCEYEL